MKGKAEVGLVGTMLEVRPTLEDYKNQGTLNLYFYSNLSHINNQVFSENV